jgi:hypothetical protein
MRASCSRLTVPYPDTSAVRSRRPVASEFASESHLRSPGGISGPAGHPARGTRASSRGSRVSMLILHAASPARRSALSKPRATGRCKARVALLTERRRRCAHAAPILSYSGPAMPLGRPCVVWAGHCAGRPYPSHLTSRSPACGSEVHGASKSRPSNLKLALVASWYRIALCSARSRQLRHVRMVNARPDSRTWLY